MSSLTSTSADQENRKYIADYNGLYFNIGPVFYRNNSANTYQRAGVKISIIWSRNILISRPLSLIRFALKKSAVQYRRLFAL